MTYATQTDLEQRFGRDELVQLTDRHGNGLVDSAVVARALADAGAVIDGYLAGRYTLPLASAPSALNRIACDLARYYLYDDAVPDAIAERKRDGIRYLEAVANGKVPLGVDDAGAEPDTGGDAVQFEGGSNVFDRNDDGFI